MYFSFFLKNNFSEKIVDFMGFELGSTIIKEIYRSLDLYHCPLFVLLSFVFKQFSIEKLKTSLGFELGSSKEKVSMLTTRPLLYHCSLFFLLSLFISSVRTIVFQIWKLVLKPDPVEIEFELTAQMNEFKTDWIKRWKISPSDLSSLDIKWVSTTLIQNRGRSIDRYFGPMIEK